MTAMRLEGSCHCGAVHFSVTSETPFPFMRCYCSICRKTAGGGGYAINIMGKADTLTVDGAAHLATYHAVIGGKASPGERKFCAKCGSALWVFDPRWPENVYPFASAIDTDLPIPPQRTHIMLDSAVAWAEPDCRAGDMTFAEYPEESIADWHRRNAAGEK